MAYLPLEIGDKIVEKPLVQGGMGVGISLGGLAGAVAKAGGLGIISAAQIGFNEPDFEDNTFEANLRAIDKEYQKAREIAPDGVIGFNIMVALQHYKEYVIQAAKAGADIIISGAGLATELPDYVKSFATKIAPIVSSERAAQVLLKIWDKKYQTTADMVVIEGPLAGGHLGFRKEEVEGITEEAYEDTIQNIIQVVKEYATKYTKKIPVVVAGGIDTAQKVKRMFEIGADGVQVASPFVATVECDAADGFKQKYVEATKEDVQLVTSPVGMPGRAVRNSFVERVEAGVKEPITKCYGCIKNCKPAEIPYCITKALITSARGDAENGLVFCGANTYRIQGITTVQEVMNALLKDC
ncbi:MAG: nitronate monooxygenase [Lachnospiraceae bacterium]|nr:nitronate monooxygenase [Lachnospiraceae bacterium]